MSIHVMRDGFISGDGSCGLKTETDDSTPTMRSRGPSSLSDIMMSEADDDGFIHDVVTHEVSQDTQEGESAISTETYGADLQRTLGEILAYCQVTYGAILKLDEKFDMLETKVANIQSLQQNPTLLSQKTCVSDSFQSRTESSTPQQLHVSSPLPSVKSRKSLMLSRGPEVKSHAQLNQNQSRNTERATNTQSSTQDPSLNTNITKQQEGRVNSPPQTSTESSDTAEHIPPANTCCVGNYERKVFLPKCVVQRAGKMTRPSAAVRHLLRNLFTADELSQSSTNGNPTRRLKRLDPNKISAIREWVVKRFPKFDLCEKGKDWKICLSVINSTARYFRFMAKTRKQKMKSNETVPPETTSSGHTAEIDVELSDSDTEQMNKINSLSNYNSDASCYMLDGSLPRQVHLGPPHREVKVPEFVLSAAHLRTRPELIARYLIKFIFPGDVLVRSNVYGARRGIQPLDHNKISALRGTAIASAFDTMFTEWRIRKENVHVVLRDNARNMVKAMEECGVKSLGCMAHLGQLAVHDAVLSQRSVVDSLAIARKIVGHFKSSPLGTSRLRDIQREMGMKTKMLQQDVPTRWNSTFLMMTTLLEQKRALVMYEAYHGLPVSLNANQWSLIEKMTTLLAPFEEMMREISSHTATAADVIPSVVALKRFLNKTAETDSGVKTTKSALLEAVNKRFETTFSEQLYYLATILDPRYKDRYFEADLKQVAKKQARERNGQDDSVSDDQRQCHRWAYTRRRRR